MSEVKLDTLNKFFRQLAKTTRKFKIDENDHVLACGKFGYNPINAVAKDLGGNKSNEAHETGSSCEFLGIPYETEAQIRDAVYCTNDKNRKRLLKTLGLLDKAKTIEEGRIKKYLKENRLEDSPKNRKAAKKAVKLVV